MSDLILSAWPRETRRGRLNQFEPYLDGRIHVVPVPPRYKDVQSFRKAISTAAAQRDRSIRTCVVPEHPGALVVQVTKSEQA